MGSATLLDEVGVDIGSHIGEYLGRVFKDRWGDPEVEISFLQEMVATGALGELDGLWWLRSLFFSLRRILLCLGVTQSQWTLHHVIPWHCVQLESHILEIWKFLCACNFHVFRMRQKFHENFRHAKIQHTSMPQYSPSHYAPCYTGRPASVFHFTSFKVSSDVRCLTSPWTHVFWAKAEFSADHVEMKLLIQLLVTCIFMW